MIADLVRLLQPTDVEVFRRIRLEALREEPAAFASTASDWELLSDRDWRRLLADTSVFVAFCNDEPVGIMGLVRQRPRKMAHRASIVMVYVRQSLRGGGVSNELFDALISYACETGIRQLELEVSAENLGAQHFYLRKGFTAFGRIPGGYLQNGREIDEILMARRVDN
ncbi:GNAT family N-acetyltransferase [Ensifer aridi]|uniref:GNAT family N-acetyltransferase n=1 Tax=Ensifer aridi TaxID=1708715 RepID=UPI000A10D44C|nr:GNAT family N-acetyltransferase [Ensifer aridi]